MDHPKHRRPKEQWWLGLRTINNALAQSAPSTAGDADEGTDV